MDHAEFLELACRNPINVQLLSRLGEAGLPDAWLVAGCLFQTVWNLASGREPTYGIADYDIFYFDETDLSWEAEDRAIRRVASLFGGLGVEVQVRNQARVHLWYGSKFGPGYPPLRSSRDGIDRFLIAGTCVGIRQSDNGFELYAPFGLEDIASGALRPNPRNYRPHLFKAKAASYVARWPWLRVADA